MRIPGLTVIRAADRPVPAFPKPFAARKSPRPKVARLLETAFTPTAPETGKHRLGFKERRACRRGASRFLSFRHSHTQTSVVTPVVQVLILANIAGFVLQSVMPALANALVFVPRLILVRPWSVVTYMFLHGGLMHLGFNMLALFFFGPRIEARIGSKRFAILFFASGVAGAVVSLFFSGSPIIGASGGVFGVMMAFAWFWPEERIFLWGVLPVPARMLVIMTTAIALFSGFGGRGGNIAHFAHLGGYAGAFLYLKWIDRARGQFRKKATAAPASAIRRVEGWRDIDMSGVHEVNREQVTRILDKIAAQGVASLTPQERTFLSSFIPMDDRAPPVQ
jgi:membrane associated rhomboid family serine protease